MNANLEEKVKQAYAYGASIALQEVGVEKTASEHMAVKMAEEPTTKQRILAALFGPTGAGLSAPEGKGWSSFGHTLGGGLIGSAGGGTLGAGAGAGIGALAALLSKGKIKPKDSALMGALLGGGVGSLGGQQVGFQKGLSRAYED